MSSVFCYLFSTKDSSLHKEAAIATVMVLDEMQSGVIYGFIKAVSQISPQIMKSRLCIFFLVQF